MGLESRPPPTPAEIAAARSEAEAIVGAAKASDLFDNVTTTDGPALRHRASGLVCSFNKGSPINKVMVFHEPRGDSIGCNTGRGTTSYSIFVDRAPADHPAVERLIGPLGAAIVKRFPDAKPAGPIVTASGKDAAGADLPPHKVVQFTRNTSHGLIEERLSVGYAGDWLIQQRITEMAADNTTADIFHEVTFLADQRAVIAARTGEPTKTP